MVATTACSPLDIIKTRIMNTHFNDSSVKHPWRMMIHMVENEGVTSLFKGWVPAFVRLGPHTIVTFLVIEQLKEWLATTTHDI